MAITQDTKHKVRVLVGVAGGLEYGFQETNIPGTVGACTNRTTPAGVLPIPQEIVELNAVASDGTIWMKFRDARLDTASPGIDIAAVSQIGITVPRTDPCTPGNEVVTLDKVAGLGYSGNSPAVRQLFIDNAESVLYMTVDIKMRREIQQLYSKNTEDTRITLILEAKAPIYFLSASFV